LRYTPDALAAKLDHLTAGGKRSSVLVVGDGARRYADQLGAVGGVTIAGPSLDSPDPAVLVTLAAARLAAGEPARPPGSVAARYLRDADATINWATRAAQAVVGG
jgi:hypothetical protein